MNKINSSLTPLVAISGAAVLSYLAFQFFSSQSKAKNQAIEQSCSIEKLIAIIEDMRIQYTPHYQHYYHMLVALQQEYANKPQLQKQIRTRIEEKVEERTNQIQDSIVEKYQLQDTSQLGEILVYYKEHSPEVERLLLIFQQNYDGLFNEDKPRQPDFKLQFPSQLTKIVYVKLTLKLFAVIRFKIYTQVREIIRNRSSTFSEKYISKEEMKEILSGLNTKQLSQNVFQLFNLKIEESDLIKAYYTFMRDQKLVQEIRTIKQIHERFVIAIMSCDVFPGLEKINPMQSQEDDPIPEKFGSKWYEHIDKPQPKVFSQFVSIGEQVDETEIDQLLEESELIQESQLLINQ